MLAYMRVGYSISKLQNDDDDDEITKWHYSGNFHNTKSPKYTFSTQINGDIC